MIASVEGRGRLWNHHQHVGEESEKKSHCFVQHSVQSRPAGSCAARRGAARVQVDYGASLQCEWGGSCSVQSQGRAQVGEWKKTRKKKDTIACFK